MHDFEDDPSGQTGTLHLKQRTIRVLTLFCVLQNENNLPSSLRSFGSVGWLVGRGGRRKSAELDPVRITKRYITEAKPATNLDILMWVLITVLCSPVNVHEMWFFYIENLTSVWLQFLPHSFSLSWTHLWTCISLVGRSVLHHTFAKRARSFRTNKLAFLLVIRFQPNFL